MPIEKSTHDFLWWKQGALHELQREVLPVARALHYADPHRHLVKYLHDRGNERELFWGGYSGCTGAKPQLQTEQADA